MDRDYQFWSELSRYHLYLRSWRCLCAQDRDNCSRLNQRFALHWRSAIFYQSKLYVAGNWEFTPCKWNGCYVSGELANIFVKYCQGKVERNIPAHHYSRCLLGWRWISICYEEACKPSHLGEVHAEGFQSGFAAEPAPSVVRKLSH